ncbi:hypothetical protein [Vibrio sp. dhg]|uniref:hypothetical protein n=1 Tax=Vibrio sp. dhg TaxID=2163016 RepID=UPI000E495E46|nr:hypothetical protein [Vibrio sp. dhg]AXT73688.1 hypothetical protein DBX26_22440 [Vibrio sp. dhg]
MFRCFLIVFSLLVGVGCANAQSSDRFIYVLGTGETIDKAVIDAKKQLALNIYSEIEVREKSLFTKIDNQVSSSFEQESSLRSLPIEISNLELVTSECQNNLCEYRFKIDRLAWSEKLTRELNNSFELAELKLENLGNRWVDFKRFSQANDIVAKSNINMKLLSSLSAKDAKDLSPRHQRVQQQLERSTHQFSISFRSSSDAFAGQLLSLLSNNAISSPQGAISIFIKTSARNGRVGGNFVVRQNVQLKIFDAAAPGVMVAQKLVTELGESPKSLAAATNDARQKLIKKLTSESIYSIFD